MRQFELFAPPKAKAPKRRRAVRAPTKALVVRPAPVTLEELREWAGDITSVLTGDMGRGCAWHTRPGDVPSVLAIDVGAQSAAAFVSRDGRAEAERAAASSCVSGAWVDWLSALLRRRPDLVVVEDAFVHARTPNPRTAISLAHRVGAVVGVAARAGVPSWRVLASEWQTRLIGKCDRETGKARSVAVASRLVGATLESDHESDAILLALFARGPIAGGVRLCR